MIIRGDHDREKSCSQQDQDQINVWITEYFILQNLQFSQCTFVMCCLTLSGKELGVNLLVNLGCFFERFCIIQSNRRVPYLLVCKVSINHDDSFLQQMTKFIPPRCIFGSCFYGLFQLNTLRKRIYVSRWIYFLSRVTKRF